MDEQTKENIIERYSRPIEIPRGAKEFLSFAKSLTDIADEAERRLKNGELVDVFEMFQEANDAIKYPKDDVLNDSVIT